LAGFPTTKTFTFGFEWLARARPWDAKIYYISKYIYIHIFIHYFIYLFKNNY
jgi:hypothetical protein